VDLREEILVMVATICTAFLVLAPGWGGHLGHRSARPAACCDACGMETAAVAAQISVLQTCPNWRVRDNAAHDLRKFDWRCHPQVASALAAALVNDREEEVREEAAQSLTKLAPRLPEVHAALRYAADRDPDHATRRWARKGLKALGGPCMGTCALCGTTAGPVVIEAPTVVAPATPAPAGAPEPGLLPPADPSPPLPPPAAEPGSRPASPPPAEVPAPLPDEAPALTPPTTSSTSTSTPTSAKPATSPAPPRRGLLSRVFLLRRGRGQSVER
jgi:hypothetical protein